MKAREHNFQLSIHKLLKLMKKEGIINISLNSNDNLIVEYSNGQVQIVNDNNLTKEQKEIKEFFQSIKREGGETYLSQKELEKALEQQNNEENKGARLSIFLFKKWK